MADWIGGSTWQEIVPHELKRTRKKKAKRISHYRQGKICAHRTVNGRGCVARLKNAGQ